MGDVSATLCRSCTMLLGVPSAQLQGAWRVSATTSAQAWMVLGRGPQPAAALRALLHPQEISCRDTWDGSHSGNKCQNCLTLLSPCLSICVLQQYHPTDITGQLNLSDPSVSTVV